ncbi:hypothetical protein NDU88_004494 [Pleurodeles waltl]|uniref:Uncharacterized protein n=1 Tax=Pleurodeles waltl TaxID=8319 RepID=A0AAV7T8X9_PLEWA|nr:hypothetical protein NDU88_004494 [Pleurodeles waltl]
MVISAGDPFEGTGVRGGGIRIGGDARGVRIEGCAAAVFYWGNCDRASTGEKQTIKGGRFPEDSEDLL